MRKPVWEFARARAAGEAADTGLSLYQLTLHGMVHPMASSTVTVRAVFIIDPKKIVRALVYYPLNVGRSVDELLRLIDALRTADKHAVALPVNWQVGDKVVVPAPKTINDVMERASHPEYERLDFYLNKRELVAAE